MTGYTQKQISQITNIIAFFIFFGLFGCQSLEESANNGGPTRRETRLQMVVNSLDLGQTPQALNEIRALNREFPNDAEILNLQGLVHLAMKSTKVAITSLTAAHKLKPRDLTYTLNLSSAYIQAGNYKSATGILMSALDTPEFKAYSNRDSLLHNLGVIAEQQGNSIRAERWYARALEENPASFVTLLKIAAIYENTHRRRLAIDRLETAKAACPRCAEPIEALVRIHLEQRQPKLALDAVESFKRNEGLTPTDSKRIIRMKRAIARYNTKPRG